MGLWLMIAKTFLRMRKIWVAGTLVTPKTISPDIFCDIIIINLSGWVTSRQTVQRKNILLDPAILVCREPDWPR